MRSEPEGWSALVITASPPAAFTASAMSGVSVATATRPISASLARRSTWTIIGRPPISSSGLPGRRVAAMRAGMSTRCGFRSSARGLEASENRPEIIGWAQSGAFIRVARAGKPISQPLPKVRRERLIPERHRGRWAALSRPTGLGPIRLWTPSNSTRFSAPFSAPACSAGDEFRRPGVFSAREAGKARLRYRREGRACRRRQGRRRAGRADREAAADRFGREGRSRRQEVRCLPHVRKGRPNRVGPNLYGVVNEQWAKATTASISRLP